MERGCVGRLTEKSVNGKEKGVSFSSSQMDVLVLHHSHNTRTPSESDPLPRQLRPCHGIICNGWNKIPLQLPPHSVIKLRERKQTRRKRKLDLPAWYVDRDSATVLQVVAEPLPDSFNFSPLIYSLHITPLILVLSLVILPSKHAITQRESVYVPGWCDVITKQSTASSVTHPSKPEKKHVIPSHHLNEFYSKPLKAFLFRGSCIWCCYGVLVWIPSSGSSPSFGFGEIWRRWGLFSNRTRCCFLLFLWFTSSMCMFELKEQRCWRWKSRWGMWITFCLTGLTHLLQIIVSGEGLLVKMSLSMWLHCKYHSSCSWVVYVLQ